MRNVFSSVMLLNGRTPTSALAIAGVMCGIFASSCSLAVLASTTPCDLPTCACTAAGIPAESVITAASTQRIATVM
jgi:hypothetical protein